MIRRATKANFERNLQCVAPMNIGNPCVPLVTAWLPDARPMAMYYLMYIVRGYDEQRAVDLKESTWSLAARTDWWVRS